MTQAYVATRGRSWPRARGLVVARRPGGLPDWLPLAAVAVAIVAAAPPCLWIAGHAHPSHTTHEIALFFHLGALVLGFGAVLVVDWVALLWTLGRRTTEEMLRAADNSLVPIWAGYSALVLSGLLLEPDLGSSMTRFKLALVLVIGLNGVVALWLHRALHRGPNLRLMVVGGCCALLSQAGWWGAIVIGHLNTR